MRNEVTLITEQSFDIEDIVNMVLRDMGNDGLRLLAVQAVKAIDSEEDFEDTKEAVAKLE